MDNGEKGGGDPTAESPDKERILKVRISGECLVISRVVAQFSRQSGWRYSSSFLGDRHDKIGTGKVCIPVCRLCEGNCCSPVDLRIELERHTIHPRP